MDVNLWLCLHYRYDARDRAVSTVERLHISGDRWEHVADMNKARIMILHSQT